MKDSQAVKTALNSLTKALALLHTLDETNKQVDDACEHIREVMDQLVGWCQKELELK